MSTSLSQVIESGGFDLSTREDAEWLLATQAEYAELIEEAEALIEKLDEEEQEEVEED